MNNVFLAVIALAVTVMAVIQVAAVVFAARAAKRVGDAVDRLEQDVRPIVASLQAMSADAARTTSMAAAQVERADRLFADLSKRVDDAVESLQQTIIAPARDGLAFLQVFRAAFTVFRHAGGRARPRPSTADEDDALFIG